MPTRWRKTSSLDAGVEANDDDDDDDDDDGGGADFRIWVVDVAASRCCLVDMSPC